MSLKALLTAAAIAATVSAAPAVAGVLYSNGPINGTINAWNISYFVTEDSFTVPYSATATSVDLGVWTSPGEQVTTIAWGINTDPSAFSTPNSAAVTTLSTCSGCGYDGEYDVSWDSFSLGSVSLNPGATYWLALTGAGPTSYEVFWDENDGSSVAYINALDYAIGSHAFEVNGVPETSTWAMMGLGFVALAFAGSRARRPANSIA